jgi:hypothetical protein
MLKSGLALELRLDCRSARAREARGAMSTPRAANLRTAAPGGERGGPACSPAGRQRAAGVRIRIGRTTLESASRTISAWRRRGRSHPNARGIPNAGPCTPWRRWRPENDPESTVVKAASGLPLAPLFALARPLAGR